MGYDASSDYGSDFTPDEEDILSSLLAQAPATPREDSGLILTNIEDDESPQRARIPHAHEDYHQQSVRNSIAEQTAYLPIEIADSSNPTADGAVFRLDPRIVLTDASAFS